MSDVRRRDLLVGLTRTEHGFLSSARKRKLYTAGWLATKDDGARTRRTRRAKSRRCLVTVIGPLGVSNGPKEEDLDAGDLFRLLLSRRVGDSAGGQDARRFYWKMRILIA